MEIIIKQNAQAASEAAARVVARRVREKPNAVLGLATGSTPLMLYKELIRLHQEDGLDFSKVSTFNLDEYIGLPPEHKQSYRRFMNENLFEHINIRMENTHVPDGMANDVPAVCAAYEQAILDAGGIDLQVLGIGSDGHVGFNEPTSSFASRTRIKTLTRRTVTDNARFFSGDESQVPHHCITMGIGTIMEARTNLLLAFGENKADAVHGMVEGPITANNPATVLQMHPSVKVCLDEDAASKLERTDYYRWVYEGKPEWQRDS